ncbi:MAG: type II secretion system protein [Planctomycetes bacterium]|nr:type II secretion system protein [Planctomycetota bacterium]
MGGPSNRRGGFVLIEIVIVLVMIAFVAALVYTAQGMLKKKVPKLGFDWVEAPATLKPWTPTTYRLRLTRPGEKEATMAVAGHAVILRIDDPDKAKIVRYVTPEGGWKKTGFKGTASVETGTDADGVVTVELEGENPGKARLVYETHDFVPPSGGAMGGAAAPTDTVITGSTEFVVRQ